MAYEFLGSSETFAEEALVSAARNGRLDGCSSAQLSCARRLHDTEEPPEPRQRFGQSRSGPPHQALGRRHLHICTSRKWIAGRRSDGTFRSSTRYGTQENCDPIPAVVSRD